MADTTEGSCSRGRVRCIGRVPVRRGVYGEDYAYSAVVAETIQCDATVDLHEKSGRFCRRCLVSNTYEAYAQHVSELHYATYVVDIFGDMTTDELAYAREDENLRPIADYMLAKRGLDPVLAVRTWDGAARNPQRFKAMIDRDTIVRGRSSLPTKLEKYGWGCREDMSEGPIEAAARQGKMIFILYAISRGYKITVPVMTAAAQKGRLDMVRWILEDQTESDAVGPPGSQLFYDNIKMMAHIAIANNHRDILTYLASRGWVPNRYAWFKAVRDSDLETFQLVVEITRDEDPQEYDALWYGVTVCEQALVGDDANRILAWRHSAEDDRDMPCKGQCSSMTAVDVDAYDSPSRSP